MELAASGASGSVAGRLLQLAWRLNAVLAAAARAAVVGLVAVMVAAIVWQVLTRAVFNRSPPWTEEVALLAFSWNVLLMVALCAREHLHVRVDLLLTALPARASAIAERLITLLIAAIGAYLVWAGTSYLLEMRGSTSQAIGYPSWLLYAAMPVAATLLLCFALENAVRGPPARPEGGA
jgi:TRAP-type transport system small permease protein